MGSRAAGSGDGTNTAPAPAPPRWRHTRGPGGLLAVRPERPLCTPKTFSRVVLAGCGRTWAGAATSVRCCRPPGVHTSLPALPTPEQPPYPFPQASTPTTDWACDFFPVSSLERLLVAWGVGGCGAGPSAWGVSQAPLPPFLLRAPPSSPGWAQAEGPCPQPALLAPWGPRGCRGERTATPPCAHGQAGQGALRTGLAWASENWLHLQHLKIYIDLSPVFF